MLQDKSQVFEKFKIEGVYETGYNDLICDGDNSGSWRDFEVALGYVDRK